MCIRDSVDATGSVVGYIGADAADSARVLELDVDLLIPAAVEGVLTEENAPRVTARVIVEGANGPTTAAADAVFAANGQLVVPDILANSGGVIVSYFEWVQANQAYWWRVDEVEAKLEERMLATWRDVLASAHSVSYTHLTLPTSCSACRSGWGGGG